MTLLTIVEQLIKQGKEGVYWDFKAQHHENNAELIHDIICLSNAEHSGDRYLIYGVSNNYEIVGIDNGKHKNQAQIIDTLRGANFADGVFPDVALETVQLGVKRLDVLIIKNTPKKPYYILQDKIENKLNNSSSKDITVRAYHIYTRIMDTNTPKNDSANSSQVERMWQEMFGLTQTPFDRLNLYLRDPEGWEQNQEYVFSNKQHPEFTIKEIDSKSYEGNETREWARGEIGYNYATGNSTACWGFYYHNTKLGECIDCQFDGGEKHIVSPDWEAIGSGRLYYYIADSFCYRFHLFMNKQKDDVDYSKKLHKVGGGCFDIPVFKDKKELDDFLMSAKAANSDKDVGTSTADKVEQNNFFYQQIDYFNKYSQRSPEAAKHR
jgi:hypothetical protein